MASYIIEAFFSKEKLSLGITRNVILQIHFLLVLTTCFFLRFSHTPRRLVNYSVLERLWIMAIIIPPFNTIPTVSAW